MSNQGPKNYSTLSTVQNNNNNNTLRTMMQNQARPKTANLVYADKPYKKQLAQWYQSTSTWRFSSPRLSFTKQQRFRTASPYSLDILEPDIKTQRSKKASSFGKGRRTPISQTVLRNAKQKPSPNAYSMNTVDQMNRSPAKGRTFASNWEKYQKLYVNYRKDIYSSHFVKNNPGAKYNVCKKPGKQSLAFTLYCRQKMFTEKMSDMMIDVPGPHYLIKDRHLYNTIGASNCSFSSGKRLDLSAPANQNPTGNQYKFTGFSDKYRNTRRKNCPN